MSIKIKVRLRPFRVPNYVLADEKARPKENGFQEPMNFHLSAIDADALSDMCHEFRANVFKKAMQADPDKHKALKGEEE